MEAPKFFDIDDEGVVVLLQKEFSEDDRVRVEAAVRSCPVTALQIEE
jgi:3-phenylpropionate/trans-cinnamate dioxygenase ferredoxin reductase subunit